MSIEVTGAIMPINDSPNRQYDAPLYTYARQLVPNIDAAIQSWLDIFMKAHLAAGVDINTRDVMDDTLLHIATGFRWDWSKMEYLVMNGADVNAKNASGDTPLHIAARHSLSKVQFLVEHGADINAQNNMGESPLHIAVKGNDSFPMVTYLVENNATLEVFDKWGQSPFFVAVCDTDSLKESQDPTISMTHKMNILHYLYDKKAKIDAVDCYGDTALLAMLRKNPDYPRNCLSQGGIEEYSRLVKFLLNRANLKARNASGKTVLHLAVEDDLIFPIFSQQLRPSMNALDINAQDKEGNTPLHIAAERNDQVAVNWLINRGANLNIVNKAGQTPAVIAPFIERINLAHANSLVQQFNALRISHAENQRNVRNDQDRERAIMSQARI
jgi:ankyrin repeat protein